MVSKSSRRFRRMLASFLAAISLSGLTVAVAESSHAYQYVGEVRLANSTVRFYDRPDLARTGRDGWCYRGEAHPQDWACNVDTNTDRRRLSATAARDLRLHNYTTQRTMTASARPLWPGHVPMCLPDWHRFGAAYHNDVWSGTNHYLCGFFS